ncbi:Gfo/Idh/MocA family protein [Tenacibaculum sp. Bg11-29]|uniref:Gfo/Idh/MocA family protein n=1 Tax=Tenacibaculum sp. Bg11-29 TaxID=2058306 RepID=UPI0012FF2D8F|nr:Gfo/Idh/MocA family oxidoreductase [Tenacibaculum sp. Bg11-29]
MNKKINWGIIGLGNIANKFAEDLMLSSDSILYGVASREINKAKKFSSKFNSIKYYDSYEELAKVSEIDIIYVATPHVFHFENVMMCLRNNKAVLCEKPMGLNSQEVNIMIEEAKSRKLFLMEALWTRFIPGTEKLIEILKKKLIGDILLIRADFGYKGDLNLNSRVYDKKLGGGSLLDVGIYPIYLSLLSLGLPTDIKVIASMTETNVDSNCSMLFNYKSGAKANLESSIERETPTEAYIYGSEGVLKIHSRFHHTEKITISRNGKNEILDINYRGNGYIYEIEEVTKCLINEEVESSKLPFTTSLDLIYLIDKVKEEIGLKYDSKNNI